VITGNLRRQIRFKKQSELMGKVVAGANYSSFVHGSPYHRSSRMRKTTPFFTTSLEKTQNFIKKEMRDLPKRILSAITK
ncbi:MAG: hypothetical protein KAS07_02845, partial [Candidatus Pacebacteria bacterium]|nr:hypothetical protein [Candidatus Paceibacterota bacterium]